MGDISGRTLRCAVSLPALAITFLSAAVAAAQTPPVRQTPSVPPATQPSEPEEATDPSPAPSVDGEVATGADGDEIVVTGFRGSLRTAQARKRTATEIVDSIVAEDIGKLGDTNVVEALQRVPGVQITRDHGVGAGIQIRGLSQTATLINGRSVPGLDLGDTPAEIIAGVDVYKNPSARLIEGGLGGVVNLRTRRPFDVPDNTISGTLRADYYDLVEKVEPVVSVLLSKRFDTGIGELGVLVNAAYLGLSGRQDQIGIEPFRERFNLVDFDQDGFFPGTKADPGDLVISPTGGGGSVEVSDRYRFITTLATQWRPSPSLELLLEGVYVKSKYDLSTSSWFANRGRLNPEPDVQFTFVPGTNIVETGAFRDVSFTSNSSINDRRGEFFQIAGTGRWDATDRLRLVADVAYSEDNNSLRSANLRNGNANPVTNGPTLTFATRTKVPTLLLSNIPTQPDQFFYYNSQSALELTSNTNWAALLDARYDLDGFIDSIEFGARYNRLAPDRRRGVNNRIRSGRRAISLLPEGFQPSPYPSFFQGTNLFNLNTLPVAPTDLTRDSAIQCEAFGVVDCAEDFSPINTYAQVRQTYALYGLANLDFAVAGIPVTGNLGARLLRTKEAVNGFRISLTGEGIPLAEENQYDNFLPSLNLRFELQRDLFLRLAAARQLTRPSLGQLAPNLTLSISTGFGLLGTAGNPDLRPLRSDSFDASLEYYFAPEGYAYLTGFYKEVDGFIQTVVREEQVNFPDFPGFTTALIRRPQNGDNGTIKGFEVGFQTFFTFLPSPLDGLGAQANYTYVDSKAPGPLAGTVVPLQGLSKHNVNLIGYYEKDRFRARLAYNWRSDYVQTTSATGSGSLPIFAEPIAFLDGSIGYRLNDNLEVTLDATNLTQARFSSYFGTRAQPRFTNIYDRRFGLSLRLTY